MQCKEQRKLQILQQSDKQEKRSQPFPAILPLRSGIVTITCCVTNLLEEVSSKWLCNVARVAQPCIVIPLIVLHH